MLFSISGVLLFSLWIFLGACAPAFLDLKAWGVPQFLRGILIFVSVLLGPIVPLVTVLCGSVKMLINRKREAEKRREIERLNQIMLENSRGMFMTEGQNEDEDGAIMTVKRLILQAVERGASDIFIDPLQSGASTVRMRVDGTLRPICELEPSLAKSAVSAVKVIASMDISEHRRPQDGAFSARIDGELISFRVASVGAYAGEKITVRVLGSAAGPRSLADLGLSPEDLDILEKSIRLPSGMILMCGPTGSGKTSTLYAMLKSIDFTLKNVISIEDPIENIMPSISQMEVNTRAGITFGSLLRNALRQNPDIICLGEIRDEETAGIAVQAAQTGHLIIGTVHSNDNLGTVDRLQNLGIPLRTIAATLHVIVSQRLVRTLCPHCKKRIELNEEQAEYFRQAGLPQDNVFAPAGCPQCDNTGYSGRRALFDIMVVNSKLRELLESENATLASIQAFIESEHGSSVIAYKGYQMAAAGLTSLDEVGRVSMNLE